MLYSVEADKVFSRSGALFPVLNPKETHPITNHQHYTNTLLGIEKEIAAFTGTTTLQGRLPLYYHCCGLKQID